MANFCEGCNEEPVTHEVLKDPVTGEYIEHHFCKNCPKAKGLTGHPPLAEPEITTTISVSVRAAEGGPEPCATCGLSFAAFRESGRFGCPTCYEHFAQQAGPLIARAHEGATHHVGKIPKRALEVARSTGGEDALTDVLGRAEERARKIKALREQLDAALAGERYEQAAMIRDQIRQLHTLVESPEGADSGSAEA